MLANSAFQPLIAPPSRLLHRSTKTERPRQRLQAHLTFDQLLLLLFPTVIVVHRTVAVPCPTDRAFHHPATTSSSEQCQPQTSACLQVHKTRLTKTPWAGPTRASSPTAASDENPSATRLPRRQASAPAGPAALVATTTATAPTRMFDRRANGSRVPARACLLRETSSAPSSRRSPWPCQRPLKIHDYFSTQLLNCCFVLSHFLSFYTHIPPTCLLFFASHLYRENIKNRIGNSGRGWDFVVFVSSLLCPFLSLLLSHP